MKRTMWLLGIALATVSLAGCGTLERRFVVYTDPPGATVLVNNHPIGWSPADDHFVYYGTYHFTIIKEGYETLQVEQKIPAPWYEYFPLDFFSENLVPWPVTDRREFHYKLEPKRLANTNQLLQEAQNLRNRGMAVSPPPPKPGGVPAPVIVPEGAPQGAASPPPGA